MNRDALLQSLRNTLSSPPPLPGAGNTAERHRFLMEIGRQDLSLARLAEAHWDAVAILHEAGRNPEPGVIYGVWASEIPGKALALTTRAGGFVLNGSKLFCSGAGLVDRALITTGSTDGEPSQNLVDLNLRGRGSSLTVDDAHWHTLAFADTKTASITITALTIDRADLVGEPGFYLSRPGFWHGACGPASCWAGGAIGLVDWARDQKRDDPHTRAHLGAMIAAAWALESLLEKAGHEIDARPEDGSAAHVRALSLRHLVEQHGTDILRRVARAYGPAPLALNEETAQRYQELDLYLRQSHAERDLEALAAAARTSQH